jgi:TM2 domain-containing membrane protein YozV
MDATAQQPAAGMQISDKKRLVAFLLWFFLGWISAHRFYVGKIGTALLQIVTLGGLGIWWLVDLILILCGAFKDKQGRPLEAWT